MEQKSLKKNAFYSVLKVFLTLVFPLITFPYASRILLPEGIGKVNFANSVISYFAIIASLGIASYATRETAKIRNDKQAVTKFVLEMLTINLICCVIAYILFFISLAIIPKFQEYRDLLLVCSIKLLFCVMGVEWIFAAFEDFKYITVRTFFVQLFSLIYLFVFVKTKDDIIHYTVFGILIHVGCNSLNILFLGKYIDIHFHPKLDLKKHIKPIFIFFGMTVVTSIYTMFDTVMLGFLSNDVEVGYYVASSKLSHMVLNMLTAISAVLLPRLTTYVQNNDSKNFSSLINKSTNVLLLLSFPMTFGLIILAKPFIILLSGENYLQAIPAMVTLSPLLIIITFGNLVGVQILPSIGKEKIAFYSYIAGALSNITLNALLIPKLGALGAAIGTICAESTVTLIQLIYSRKYIFHKDLFITFIESLFASIIMTVGLIFIIRFINSNIFQLIISFIFGIIIYTLMLFIFKNKFFIFYSSKIFNFLLRKK